MDSISWKPSRFNLLAWDVDQSFLVFNSLSGAFMRFSEPVAKPIADLLAQKSIPLLEGSLMSLAEQGIVVPEAADELQRARSLHQSMFERDDHLQLILMPTEQCNFRCVYCYEEFLRGPMSKDVVDGVVRLVEQRAAELRSLAVCWFGGEPLAAIRIIEAISARLLAVCAQHGITFTSSMTTNGYLLTVERAARCLHAEVRTFQITLDGPPETHNSLRKLAGGGKTFDTIFTNLCALQERTDNFHVRIRVNYTPDVVAQIPQFLTFLGHQFGGDSRFSIHCHAVGHWGGPNDHLVETCEQKTAESVDVEFMSQAMEAGFNLDSWKESMRPFGSVCYAADPQSFVIGSDGTVYKCTVAFNDPRNQIGKLTPEGRLEISDELHRLWTSSGEEVDTGCQQCAFRPACQGNLCPLERLNTGQKVCAPVKRNPGHYLPILAAETIRLRPV